MIDSISMKTVQHTALTAAREFRGGTADLVTRPLEAFDASGDTYGRLAVQERPASIFANVYVVATEKGAYDLVDAMLDALDAMHPAECASN
jgi:hypothetical protein